MPPSPGSAATPAKPLYLAANPVEAEIVKDFLVAHGIATRIQGSYAWGGVGELPLPEAYPRLYLEQESHRARALELLREYERGSAGSWCCRGCGERSPDTFAVCWSCGSAAPA